MTSFQQAAMQRADTPEQERIPFYLFADEFQNFITDSPEAFADTLAETRKYKLFLTLLHQFTAQIHDQELRHALLGNAGNVLVFRVSGYDAELLECEFTPHFQRTHLTYLTRGEVVAKLQENGKVHFPILGTVSHGVENRHDRRETIITQSRRLYTNPRADVEEKINRFLALEPDKKKPAIRRAATKNSKRPLARRIAVG